MKGVKFFMCLVVMIVVELGLVWAPKWAHFMAFKASAMFVMYASSLPTSFMGIG